MSLLELLIAAKNSANFHTQKEFLGYIFSARRNSNFHKKKNKSKGGLPKSSFRMSSYFAIVLDLVNFVFIFCTQSQSNVFTITGQKKQTYI